MWVATDGRSKNSVAILKSLRSTDFEPAVRIMGPYTILMLAIMVYFSSQQHGGCANC
jgi:hypothetical protein